MAETKIEWCRYTHNVAWGCDKVSPACKHCYAEAWAKRTGHDVWGPGGERRTFGPKHWAEPLKWNRLAQKAGKPELVFCSSMADVFEDHPTLAQERLKLWPLIEETPWLRWLLLTKRPENHRMVPDHWRTKIGTRPNNVWFGTTVENQEWAEKRLHHLLAPTWPSVRFVSYEPALDAVDFTNVRLPDDLARSAGLSSAHINALTDQDDEHFFNDHRKVDWLIVGGESGSHARPFDLSWARSAVRQGRENGTAIFVKQMGAVPVFRSPGMVPANAVKLRSPKGADMQEWPEDLRIREFPESHAADLEAAR